MAMTLTLELEDLRRANEEALAQLGCSTQERFDPQLAEIENFLLTVYRFAVLAELWRGTLDVIDRAASRVQALAAQHGGVHPSLDRILEIRYAASEMLGLYA